MFALVEGLLALAASLGLGVFLCLFHSWLMVPVGFLGTATFFAVRFWFIQDGKLTLFLALGVAALLSPLVALTFASILDHPESREPISEIVSHVLSSVYLRGQEGSALALVLALYSGGLFGAWFGIKARSV